MVPSDGNPKREDVIGKDFFDFVVDDNITDLRKEHFAKLNDLGEIRDSNYLLRQANGSDIAVAISEVAQRDFDGKLTESLAVLNDLSVV